LGVKLDLDYVTGAGAPRQADLDAIRAALERAGVEFIDGDRPGVRLGKRGRCDADRAAAQAVR
jgi:hypothetical protein